MKMAIQCPAFSDACAANSKEEEIDGVLILKLRTIPGSIWIS